MANYRKLYFDNAVSIKGLYCCKKCGKLYPKEKLDVDHIIPKSKGGPDALWNLQGLCYHCNRSKGNKTDDTVKDLATHALAMGATKLINGIFKK